MTKSSQGLFIRWARAHGWTAVHVSHFDSNVILGCPPGGKAYDPLEPVPKQKAFNNLTKTGKILFEEDLRLREREVAAELDVHWQKSQRGRKDV